MDSSFAPISRRVLPVLRERLREAPVLVINGPRTVGKSTLLQHLAADAGADVLDLDDLPTRQAVQDDPTFFMSADSPVLVDEYQHVPDLLSAVKAELNKDLRPGRFVLTGSTRYGTLPQAATFLTGRVQILELLPFSQGEISGTQENFVELLLNSPEDLLNLHPSRTQREEYAERVTSGGFPIALQSPSPAARNRWFRDFVDLVVTKDVLELSKVHQRSQMPLLLRSLASRTGQVVNMTEVAQEAGLSRVTAQRYSTLLEAVFLLRELPAWATTATSRVSKQSKIHVIDSGLAAWLLGLTPEKLTRRTPAALTEFGHLLETFVVNEVWKQASWSDELIELGHYRTHDDEEVDLILETHDGRVAALEVKASSRVPGKDFNTLKKLRNKLGSRFVGGVVLYQGERSYTYDDRLHVMPIDTLWMSGTG